ncbi:MAG: helix-turn-helix domain-containing protein [Candidatus Krumholzibacteriota bacterium]|nr:helix-turn-helix domain-containing protein [Candidatus Krumholzibacteriota bacterium]
MDSHTFDALLEEIAARVAEKIKLPPAEPQGLLDTDGVARFLKVSRETVTRTLVRRHGLPHTRIGREFRFDPDAVMAWARARGRVL